MAQCLIAVVSSAFGAVAFESVDAWRDLGGAAPFVFPEEADTNVMKRPPHAMVVSGGGARAYASTMGYLRALTDEGLIQRLRYLGGASGGAWGATAYAYAQVGSSGVAATDAQLLGDIVAPANISLAALGVIDALCLRSSVTVDAVPQFLEAFLANGLDARKAMISTLHTVFLAKAGIPAPFAAKGGDGAPFAASAAAAASATARNPAALGALKPSDWLVPSTAVDRPLLTIGFTVLGPKAAAPLDSANRSYAVLEVSPYAVGAPRVARIAYNAKAAKDDETIVVGGLIESFAFGADAPSTPAGYLPTGGASAALRGVPQAAERFTLAHASASSGWAWADVIAADVGPLAPIATKALGFSVPLWSVASELRPPAPTMMLGDAGITENLHFLSLLRRRALKSFVVFTHSSIALATNATWDPSRRAAKASDIDDTLPSYFGLDPDPLSSVGYDYHRNHVFDASSFAPFAAALQASAARGNGTVVRVELTTVRNDWWGIEAGRKVNATWFYLSRVYEWERALPAAVRTAVGLDGLPRDTQALPTTKRFPKFPHLPTGINLSAEQSNLLANLCGWVVQRNAALLHDALESNGSYYRE
jgi:hypothetical protein